jgi:hypothetical protein
MTHDDVPTILEAMSLDDLWGAHFRGDSWLPWKTFLAALYALPPTPEMRAIYEHHTHRTEWPLQAARECWADCGRRSGKSAVAGLVSVYQSVFKSWTPYLAPGEVATSMTVSPDRRQSRVISRFQRGLLRAVPMLQALVRSETREGLELSGRVVLETQTADPMTLRGYVSHVIINDEVCFLPTENSARPDDEILQAERPCLVGLPGSLLLSISSPYARRGALYEAYQRHFGKDGDPVLFWKGTSLEMNPTLDPKIIADAYERDSAAASAEFGAEFRSDCERLFNPDLLENVTDGDRPLVIPYIEESEEVRA